MARKGMTPLLAADSFTCPHCGAMAHQTWFKLYVSSYEEKAGPWFPDESVIEKIKGNRKFDADEKVNMIRFFKRKMTRQVFFDKIDDPSYLNTELINVVLSKCYSCGDIAIWVADKLLYPAHDYKIEPTEDMPQSVKTDFLEAAKIVDQSPRGAAALLRLAIQELMKELKESGKDLNGDIGSLVKKGLPVGIQQALDVVRVIGNNAVHPGQIDLKDNTAVAMKLFGLVNIIVEDRITKPEQIKALYETLPSGALAAIEKRDGGK
jgi:hypothetical protein